MEAVELFVGLSGSDILGVSHPTCSSSAYYSRKLKANYQNIGR